MMDRFVPLLALAAFTQIQGTPIALAQTAANPYATLGVTVDSGFARSQADTWEVVLAIPVEARGAESLRVHLNEIELAGSAAAGTESMVRVTSLRDGFVQHHTRSTLEQWGGYTAFFNGDSVLIEVIAHPGTGRNRFVVDEVEAQLEPLFPASICGNEDDRVPSDDARVARTQPSTCTAWLTDMASRGALTAGHCANFGTGYDQGDIIEFNVPLSTASGSLVHPPPSEQYAIDLASEQGVWGVVGNDWWSFAVFPNTETGLWPYQAQGEWFTLAQPPASPDGQTIRITGHGIDSTPQQYNSIQQTHTGDLVEAGQILRYTPDTTGGNSGSPVIWEDQGVAIGIHTNGGCTSSGGSNSGTGLANPGLQQALANPVGLASLGSFGGAFTDLGGGLGQGSIDAPLLTGAGDLTPGSEFRLTTAVFESLPAAIGLIVFGATQVDMPFAGGLLVPDPQVVLTGDLFTFTNGYGLQALELVWPTGLASGTELFVQTWIVSPNLVNESLLGSNGLRVVAP